MTSSSPGGPSKGWPPQGRTIARPPTPALNPITAHQPDSSQSPDCVLDWHRFVWSPDEQPSDHPGHHSQNLQFPPQINGYNPHANSISNNGQDNLQLDPSANSMFGLPDAHLDTTSPGQVTWGQRNAGDLGKDSFDEFSLDGFCSAASSISASHSRSSADSFSSRLSPIPKYNKRRRRGRSAGVPKLVTPETPVVRRYQCTFCTDSFKTKYDWQRHEATIHLSLEQWNCTKSGPVIPELDGSISCIFCGCRNPGFDHFDEHRYSECLVKPPEERVFRRKDHLRQHLRIAHNGCSFNEKMESWFSSIDEVNSRCGFCDARLGTWTERQRHLAQHFKKGADIKDWKGDRGFDGYIERLVENDMPVFMIGDQRTTMEPFSASQVGHQTETETLNIPDLMNEIGLLSQNQRVSETTESEPGPSPQTSFPGSGTHSYRQVEALLLACVLEQLSQGRVPSDEHLQEKTSEIIFGPDNTWDQTWADNREWLESFKKKAGLMSLPFTNGKNAFIGTNANG